MVNEPMLKTALDETDALIKHLVEHPNTPPTIAVKLIQRFTTSNPSPDYVKDVATAFTTGTYEGIGSGEYACLKATIAAVLLHPTARSPILDMDPSHGTIREPFLKLLNFMRAMEYTSDGRCVGVLSQWFR